MKVKKLESVWKEILTVYDKKEFQNIQRILVRYYELAGNKGKALLKFRKKLVSATTEDFRVFIKPAKGISHFAVVCDFPVIGGKEKWIHIDGIFEERQIQKNRNHPVFKITCLTDLYDRAKEIKNLKKFGLER